MAAQAAAEMNALGGERGGSGGNESAVEAWRKKVANVLDGPPDRAAAAGNYGTLPQRSFPPPAPSDNLPTPQWDDADEHARPRIVPSRVLTSEGDDDEWAQVKSEFGGKKAGPVAIVKRLPAHVLVMITVVAVVAAVLCAIVFVHPGGAGSAAAAAKKQALAGKPVAKPAAKTPAGKAVVPPLTGAQKKEVEKLASQQAAQMASAAMAAAQQAEQMKEEEQQQAQRQAEAAAKASILKSPLYSDFYIVHILGH
jgi:hypothetical protein